MRKILLACLMITMVMALLGCGRSLRLKTYLDGFKGKPTSAFIAHNGVPDSQADLRPSGRLYEWHKNYSGPSASAGQVGQANVQVNIGGTAQRPQKSLWCVYRVTADAEDIIQEIVWEGNYCRPVN